MSGPERYRVVAVEPDERFRTRLTIQLAGLAPAPFESLEALLEQLGGDDPMVVVFGPGLANDTGLAHAQRLTRTHPMAGIVLLAEELTLPLLQQALRSGVRDAIGLEADDATLRQAVERVGDAIATIATRSVGTEGARRGRVIVAFSTKGGVGKSVVATNTASSLASKGQRVVIVDSDLQFGDVAVLLSVPPLHTTVEAAGAIAGADTQLMEGLLATHELSGLRVLPAPVEPSAADQITAQEMVGIVQLLRTMFDFIVIDLPPHFDDVVVALLEEADDVLLVASMDIPSIKNLKVGIQTLDLLALAGSKIRLVLNRANAKVNLDIGDVERALGVPADFRVPSDISVPQAVNRGIPVVLDKPKSPAGAALHAIADSFLVSDAESSDPEPRRRTWRRPE
ncbi:MAG: cobyrinic acid a,c-diamide synthase [Actinomycetia bacterium]|nr:cobyrinic acid a,c-diamide synthase [Actinomycetes bacterium]